MKSLRRRATLRRRSGTTCIEDFQNCGMPFWRIANRERTPLLSRRQVLRGCSLDTHEHYEEMCALAVSGQASQAELADLKAHLESCATCRGLADDFTQVSAQGLSMVAAKRSQCAVPSGMTQRFIARARSEGIEINPGISAGAMNWNRAVLVAATGAVAAVILISGIVTIRKIHFSSVEIQPQSPPRQGSVARSTIP